jgi:carbon dioxide concentrating mechanism protein CcmL
MELAVVVGQCTATVKDTSLGGRKLALVRRADAEGAVSGEVEVALDVTGAGAGQLVLLVRGSAARQCTDTRQLPADLAIVAIVDEVTTSGSSAGPVSASAPNSSRTMQEAPSSTAAARTRTRGK